MHDLLKELLDRTPEWRVQHPPKKSRHVKLRDTASPGWIAFDDIEFHLPEPLTADELAQCLVELTRSSPLPHMKHGETEHYRLFYDQQHPGEIVLKRK